jgi:phenylalanyl-tRNA synthetase beta subunit
LFIEGFEYGHVFSGKIFNKFSRKRICCWYFWWYKNKINLVRFTKPLSWFEAKGKIEQLFKQLNIVNLLENLLRSIYNKIFHPYRTAELYLSDKTN